VAVCGDVQQCWCTCALGDFPHQSFYLGKYLSSLQLGAPVLWDAYKPVYQRNPLPDTDWNIPIKCTQCSLLLNLFVMPEIISPAVRHYCGLTTLDSNQTEKVILRKGRKGTTEGETTP
jgi:hypothetical protein